jgi:hypothetical protein
MIVSPTFQQLVVQVGWSIVTEGGVFPDEIWVVVVAVMLFESVTVSRAVYVPAA